MTAALRRAYDTGYRHGRQHAAAAVQAVAAEADERIDRTAAAQAARGGH